MLVTASSLHLTFCCNMHVMLWSIIQLKILKCFVKIMTSRRDSWIPLNAWLGVIHPLLVACALSLPSICSECLPNYNSYWLKDEAKGKAVVSRGLSSEGMNQIRMCHQRKDSSLLGISKYQVKVTSSWSKDL